MKSEFLESELELYVQRLLIHEFYATGNQYKMLKISPNEERHKGYDAKISGAKISGMAPFYCQFKTSNYLRQGKIYKQRQDFCTKTRWPKLPFYSFSLREPSDPQDKKNPKLWQHNVLHSLWRHNQNCVAYVAPIFHTRTEMNLHEPLGTLGCCFCDHEFGGCLRRHRSSGISIQAAVVNGHAQCRLPFFDGLISIPPHVPVKDLKHSYCYTSPSDVTFHSEPEKVNGNAFNEALRLFVLDSIENNSQKVSDAKLSFEAIKTMIGVENVENKDQDNDFLESFLAFGLVRAGVSSEVFQQNAATYFEKEATWLQQRIAFAAALSAYFGISTLGLLRIEEG